METVREYASDLRRNLEKGCSTQGTLIFYGATPAHAEAISQAGANLGRTTYFGEDQYGVLYFQLPVARYEAAHLALLGCIYDSIGEMSLSNLCSSVGGTAFKSARGARKHCDSGLRPNPPRTQDGRLSYTCNRVRECHVA